MVLVVRLLVGKLYFDLVTWWPHLWSSYRTHSLSYFTTKVVGVSVSLVGWRRQVPVVHSRSVKICSIRASLAGNDTPHWSVILHVVWGGSIHRRFKFATFLHESDLIIFVLGTNYDVVFKGWVWYANSLSLLRFLWWINSSSCLLSHVATAADATFNFSGWASELNESHDDDWLCLVQPSGDAIMLEHVGEAW